MTLSTRVSEITARYAQQTSIDESRISWDFVGAPHGDTGAAFKPPSIDPTDPEAAIWQRIIVRWTPRSARRWGIGDAPVYADGVIAIDTFFPRYSSPATALTYAEEAKAIFDSQNFGSIRCRDGNGPDFTEIDRFPNFKLIQVVIPFYIYEVN
jgi:hypothetical protein